MPYSDTSASELKPTLYGRVSEHCFKIEIWKLAWQALLSNRVRAFLTMLGIVIGTACVVLVVSIGLAGRRYIIGQIEGVGANVVYAQRVDPGNGVPSALQDEISPEDMDAVKAEVPDAVHVAGTRDLQMTVIANSKPYPVTLVGVTQGFQEIRRLVVDRGSYFTLDDLVTQSKVCLITQGLASLVYPSESPVGKDIRVGELHFSVIGVFHERAGVFGGSEITDRSVIVPFPVIRYYTGSDYFATLYAQSDQPAHVETVTSEVAEVLHDRHRPQAQYLAQNLSGILDTARTIALSLTIFLVLVALIALAISGVGIMNIMLVTVTERTREIGIRKAIGARQDAIRFQFLIEALLISGSGALLGIAIAIAIPMAVNFTLRYFPELGDISLPVYWPAVIIAFLISCGTGIIFGSLPANRAAGLQPTESLHYE